MYIYVCMYTERERERERERKIERYTLFDTFEKGKIVFDMFMYAENYLLVYGLMYTEICSCTQRFPLIFITRLWRA